MTDPIDASRGIRLTDRERDVLIVLCRPVLGDAPFTEPASIRAIAASLVVTDAAVKQHLLHLYDKFALYDGAENRRVRLANEALARGVVTMADLGTPSTGIATRGRGRSRTIAAAGEAASRGDWEVAYADLADAARGGPLDPEALELLGHAAFWTERQATALEVRERAHAAFVERGDRLGAGRTAIGLAISHVARGRGVVAGGWLGTARRLLDGPAEGPEHGLLAAIEALFAIASGDHEASLVHSARAIAVGERHGERDVVALGNAYRGYALVHLGRRAEGLALLDVAMVEAIGGRLGPLATDQVFCRTLGACLESWDYRRAVEWADALLDRTEQPWPTGATGDCRAHRVVVDVVRGDWRHGEAEAATAALETECFDLGHVAIALTAMAEMRIRSGDLEGATAALRQAREAGGHGQPALARLELARGEADRAVRGLVAALESGPGDPLGRAALLPAVVDAAVVAGDHDLAQRATDELAETAALVDTAALRGAAACAAGAVAWANGDAARAADAFRDGWRAWTDAGAPYEAARARLGLAAALDGRDDDEATVHRDAARAALHRLGAVATD